MVSRRDAGESLIEILVSVTILAGAVVGLLTALVGLGNNSGLHREQIRARAYLIEAADAVRSQGYKSSCSAFTLPTITAADSNLFNNPSATNCTDVVASKMQTVLVTITWKTRPTSESITVGTRTP